MVEEKSKACIKLLYLGNLFRVICTILIIAGAALSINAFSEVSEDLSTYQTIVGVIVLLGTIGLIGALIAVVVGVYGLRGKSKLYKISYYLYIASLFLVLTSGLLPDLSTILTIISRVVELVAGYFLIKGTVEYIEETKEMKGIVIIIYTICYIFSITSYVFESYISTDIAEIFNILTSLFQIISYIFLVGFFKRAHEGLKKVLL